MSIFCLKRLVIAFVTSSVRDPISVPILIYTKLSLFTIGYTLKYKPFETTSNNIIDILNESFILVSGYYLIIFSEWIYDPKSFSDDGYSDDPGTKYNFGYVYISFVALILFVNFSYVFYEQIR